MDTDDLPKASAVIARIQRLIDIHGDLPVVADDADTGWRLPIGIVYRPNKRSEDDTPRFEIKTEYSGEPDGHIN